MWWKKHVAEPRKTPQPQQPPQPQSVLGLLDLLNHQLELGMLDKNILRQVFDELESTPEKLLPGNIGTLSWTSFLLWKDNWPAFGKRILFMCLAWYLKNTEDEEAIRTITENIQRIYEKEGHPASIV